MEFTKGDMRMLPKLIEFGNIETAANAWEERQKIINEYLEPALQVYFAGLGVNPFEEGGSGDDSLEETGPEASPFEAVRGGGSSVEEAEP